MVVSELGFRSVGDNVVTPMRDKLGNPWMVGMQLELSYFPFPNIVRGVDGIQNCGFVRLFAHRTQVYQVSLNSIWR